MANIERLEQLKRVVRDAPGDRFDMRYFGTKTACGTVCCAAGWAALDPWFLANTEIAKVLPKMIYDPLDGRWWEENDVFQLGGPEHGSFQRLGEVFDLTDDDTDALFNGETRAGVTKEDVIENIDRIVGGVGALEYGGHKSDEDDE